MVDDGRKLSASARIPVREMAFSRLEALFPHLTATQIESLREGTPMPPSPAALEQYLRSGPAELSPAQKKDVFDGRLLRHIVSRLSDVPLVSCVMAFDRPRPSMRLARRAVEQFMAQSYPNKQLVVVNCSGSPVTNTPHRFIKEIRHVGQKTPAELRNIGLAAADGDWAKPFWDDDDYFDPHLLTFQMLYRQEGRAILLTHQPRVAIYLGTSYLCRDDDGVADTMIVPRVNGKFPEFPAHAADADAAYANANFGHSRVAVNNADFPANCLSIAMWHDDSKADRAEFLGPMAGPEREGQCDLGAEEAVHVRSVLVNTFGLTIGTHVTEDIGATGDATVDATGERQ